MSSEERARRERERKAAIQRAINAKQQELDGVNAEIAKYEAILNALTESQTTLASYKADLETDINDVIVNYDVKDGSTWAGLQATKAWREMDFLKNKKDNYVTEVEQLDSDISTAIDKTNSILQELYSRRDSLNEDIRNLRAQL